LALALRFAFAPASSAMSSMYRFFTCWTISMLNFLISMLMCCLDCYLINYWFNCCTVICFVIIIKYNYIRVFMMCLIYFVIFLLKKLVCRHPILQHLVNRYRLCAVFLGTLNYGNHADVENLPNQCPKTENMCYIFRHLLEML
jgi:hypothetical protein